MWSKSIGARPGTVDHAHPPGILHDPIFFPYIYRNLSAENVDNNTVKVLDFRLTRGVFSKTDLEGVKFSACWSCVLSLSEKTDQFL